MTLDEQYASIEEKIPKVFDAGKKAEHDHFWDVFQQNGERVDYRYAFAQQWTNEIFKPKYDIKPTNAERLFFNSGVTQSGLDAAIASGIYFDFSKATNMSYAFSSMRLKKITFDISLESCTTSASTGTLFGVSPMLTAIKKIILKSDGSTPFGSNMFNQLDKLADITFEGVIGKALDMKSCSSLSVESMKNIISHLANYKGTDNEFVHKLTLHDDAWARLEASGTSPTGTTWKEYVDSLGWNT